MENEKVALELIKLHDRQLSNDVTRTVKLYLSILTELRKHEYNYKFDKQVEEELG